jgi:phospholipid/cholesterol/gamma-HCH transport system substrate-binding protein
METRARFILLGFFTLAVIVAGFGFVYWLNYAGTSGDQTLYRIRFQDTVSGLRSGSAVLFNGIRVGEVKSLRLDTSNPREVTATVSVQRNTPIRPDTRIEIYSQGLMGAPTISLLGGSAALPPLTQNGQEPPLLVADPAAGQDMMQTAREALRRVDTVLTENAEPLRDTIANLKSFTDALARNSDRVDSIAKGLERMVGGQERVTPTIYDLTAPTDFAPLEKAPSAQLVVEEPSAVLLFDTQKILVHSKAFEGQSFADVQWSDSLPKLFAARIIQSFENAGYGRVGREIDGLAANFKLLVDIRNVRLAAMPDPTAEIEIGAKIMDEDGKIVATRLFRATAPAGAIEAAAAAAAIDVAFGKTMTELVRWAIGIVGA